MRISLCCVAVFAVCLAGCGSDPEEAMLDTVTEMAELIENAKTKEDAEAVKERLRELAQQAADYGKQMKDKWAEDPEAAASYAKEFLPKIMEAYAKIADAMRKNPEVSAVLQKALESVEVPK